MRRVMQWYRDPAYFQMLLETINSVIGVQHGDPLGGLLFDLVIHRLIIETKDMTSLSNGDKEVR